MATYLVTHSHSPAGCEDATDISRKMLESMPPQIKQVYLQPGEHIFYFVVEAQDHREVYRLFRELEEYGINDIVPVLNREETMEVLHS